MQRLFFEEQINEQFEVHAVCALIGPRQIGKTTLAKQYAARFTNTYFFDLENPTHLTRLEYPMLTLDSIEADLIVIDEIQRRPELFPVLRVLVDERPRKFLILGSASRDLLQQSSETLAGRIGYIELTTFSLSEGAEEKKLWLQGGFPKSYLSSSKQSYIWRRSYITTFLERDIPTLGYNIPPMLMRKLWMMVAHYHGQVLNASEIGKSLSLSYHTVKKYMDILEGTFMIRMLQPWFENISKRQIKSPKLYIRDSGLLHALLDLQQEKQLQFHSKLGASWEGFALEEIIKEYHAAAEECYFWATQAGAELDLLLIKDGRRLGFEFKYTDAPKVTPSMRIAIETLQLDHLYVVFPYKEESFPLSEKITARDFQESKNNDYKIKDTLVMAKNSFIIYQLILPIVLLTTLNSCDACKNNGVRKAEATAFEIELEASDVQLFPNQSTAITLTILSNDPKASSLEYSLEKLELTSGKLFLEGMDEELAVGTKLDFGTQNTQNLIFKPSKEGGDAAIKLTVVSSERHASEAKINIKVVEVRLEMQAEPANISAYHPIPLSLKLSSSYQEAQDLTYTIKEIESTKGAVVLEDSGKEAKPGDLLTYGAQGLIFTPKGELGEAAIKLTLVSNQGHEVSTKFTLQLRPADLKVSMQPPLGNAFLNRDSEIVLEISSTMKGADQLNYTVKKVDVDLGKLFLESGEEVKTGTPLKFGVQKLIFKPRGIDGKPYVELIVENGQRINSRAIIQFEIAYASFEVTMLADDSYMFAHQNNTINLKIINQYKRTDRKASKLAYTVKEIKTSFGSVTFKNTGENVLTSSKLKFGKQYLVFNPCGKEGEAVISLTVVSERGDERSASLTINVVPIDFDVEGFATFRLHKLSSSIRVAESTMKKNQWGVIELKIIEKKEQAGTRFYSGPWYITGWSFSDRVKRKLMDEYGKELTHFPIPINRGRVIRLCIDIGEVRIGTEPRLKFFIKGAQGTAREVEVSLKKIQANALSKRVEAYKESVKLVSNQIECYLPGGPYFHSYRPFPKEAKEIRELSGEAAKLLEQFEKVRKELSAIDQWWKGPALTSLLSLSYGEWAINDLNMLVRDLLPKLFELKNQLDYVYGIK